MLSHLSVTSQLPNNVSQMYPAYIAILNYSLFPLPHPYHAILPRLPLAHQPVLPLV